MARVRQLEPSLDEFGFCEDALSDALTVADQTVGPGGRQMTVEERMADMLSRHGDASPNALAHARRQPYLVAAARRVAARLQERGEAPQRHRLLLESSV